MRKGNVTDKSVVLDILTRSFDINKSVNYVVKQDRRRTERIRMLMDYSFNTCFKSGDVWLSDNGHACALILFPDKTRTSLRSILGDIKLAWSVIGISRVATVLRRESMIKEHHPKEPFAYLWFVGVDPHHQGKAIGSELLEELIAEYSKQGRPIYLETSMERNLPLYRKFGFEIFHTTQLTYMLYHLRRL